MNLDSPKLFALEELDTMKIQLLGQLDDGNSVITETSSPDDLDLFAFVKEWNGNHTPLAEENIKRVLASPRIILRAELARTKNILSEKVINVLLDDTSVMTVKWLLDCNNQITPEMLDYAYKRAEVTLANISNPTRTQESELYSIMRSVSQHTKTSKHQLYNIAKTMLEIPPKTPFPQHHEVLMGLGTNVNCPTDLLELLSIKFSMSYTVPYHHLQSTRMHMALIKNHTWLNYLCEKVGYPKDLPTDWVLELFYGDYLNELLPPQTKQELL